MATAEQLAYRKAIGFLHRKKTCGRGHDLTKPGALKISGSHRACRECVKITRKQRAAEYRALKMAQVAALLVAQEGAPALQQCT